MSTLGVLAGALAVAAPAWACTNYVGKVTVTGNASANTTISTGQQCAENVGTAERAHCNEGMTLSTSAAPGASAHLGGTIQLQTDPATTGTCPAFTSPTETCRLNDEAAINYPSGNSGYNVNVINVGFTSHTSNPTAAQDCMSWPGQTTPLITVATATVDGTTGKLNGATGANGYSASISGNVATVRVPGAPWTVNSGTQEAGVCISDVKGKDGIQAPFKIVT